MRPRTPHRSRRARATAPRRPPVAVGRTIPFQTLLHASIIFALSASFILASRLPLFTVEKVVVRGGDVALRKKVQSRIVLPPDASTLTVNIQSIRREVEKEPGVAMASVTRCLPNRIEVEVVPREAKAAVRHGEGFVLVDGGGVCFARTDAAPEGLDQLWGIDVGDGRPGTRVASSELGVALQCIALAHHYDPKAVWTFDFSKPGELTMRGPNMKALLGDAGNLHYKMAIVFAAPEAARKQGLASYTIDVRRPEAPVLSR
jgi:hypothetical protein